MKIWVDIPTGTWGCIEDLVFVEASDEELNDIEDMTDTDRYEWAYHHPAAQKLIDSSEVFTDVS